MRKHLLATTAAISLIATPFAFAQDAAAPQNDSNPIFSQQPYEGQATGGFYAADPNQILATRFIGANIYSGTGDDAEVVGDVNDIIMTPDGRAVAVITGVGGFLGIGEKEVAVSMDSLTWRKDADGNDTLVGQFAKADLEAAPAFDRDALTAERTAELPADKTMNEGAMATDQTAATETMPKDQMDQTAANENMATENAADPDSKMVTAATPKMEMTPAGDVQFKATDLIGMTVVGANEENVGEVSDVLVDDGGKVNAFIIDVGGFLGMNEKPVAVSMQDLQFARVEGSSDWTEIKTGLTKEALESQTAYSESAYKENSDSVILISPMQ